MTENDAPFILELVNEPSWIQHIGNKNVRTIDDAKCYIERGPVRMYREHGFGLNLVELHTGQPVGICGLIRREGLDDVDLGFAFVSRVWGNGYALEAASATMHHARRMLGFERVVAIVSRGNDRSTRLLNKLGFALERRVRLDADGPELELYAARRHGT